MNPIYDGYQGGTSMPSGRKKMNPHYEGYQPHNKVISTKGSSKPPQHGSPVKQCSQCSVQCLKSPCTTFLVILVVFLMVIAGVLIFMGKITTPATGGSTSELSQPKPSTPNPSYTPILMPIEVQQRLEQQDSQIKQMQEQISMLQTQLQDLLGGSDEDVNASLSTKVVQNARAIMRVEEEQTRQQGSIAGLTASIHNDQQIINTVLGDITNIKSRTANLENNSTILDNQVKVLTAKSETQTTDIRNINNKNENQDTQIIGIESQIALVEQDYKFELRVLNRTIYEELDVISKMQGPRGYNGSQGLMGEPGAGNLTRCVYGTQNNGGPLTQPETSTPWVVAGEGYTFVALTCSSRGGTSTYLATNPNDATQYDCTCTGNNAEREDFRGRDCIIHFWKCPTIT